MIKLNMISMKTVVGLVLILIAFSVETSPGTGLSHRLSADLLEVSISISPDTQIDGCKLDNTLSVRIENKSDSPLVIRDFPEFLLERTDHVPGKKGEPAMDISYSSGLYFDPIDQKDLLNIAPRQNYEVDFKISKFMWTDENSSLSYRLSMCKVIKSGEFTLSLRIVGHLNSIASAEMIEATSNAIAVSIVCGKTKPPQPL